MSRVMVADFPTLSTETGNPATMAVKTRSNSLGCRPERRCSSAVCSNTPKVITPLVGIRREAPSLIQGRASTQNAQLPHCSPQPIESSNATETKPERAGNRQLRRGKETRTEMTKPSPPLLSSLGGTLQQQQTGTANAEHRIYTNDEMPQRASQFLPQTTQFQQQPLNSIY